MNTPTLETERLILRKFTRQDIEALYLILRDEEVNKFLPWYPVKNIEETEKFYEEKSKSVPNYKVDSTYNKMIAICDAMKEIINNTQEYYDELENTEDIEDTYTEIMEYEAKLKKYQNSKITEVNQLLINSAQNDLDDMRSLYDELELEIEDFEEEDDYYYDDN